MDETKESGRPAEKILASMRAEFEANPVRTIAAAIGIVIGVSTIVGFMFVSAKSASSFFWIHLGLAPAFYHLWKGFRLPASYWIASASLIVGVVFLFCGSLYLSVYIVERPMESVLRGFAAVASTQPSTPVSPSWQTMYFGILLSILAIGFLSLAVIQGKRILDFVMLTQREAVSLQGEIVRAMSDHVQASKLMVSQTSRPGSDPPPGQEGERV